MRFKIEYPPGATPLTREEMEGLLPSDMGVRWIFRKKAIATSKLGRAPTAEEIILEYKGLLKSKTKWKDEALGNFRKNYELLKSK